ncbi:ankyrin repeat domain-containing protein [Aliarcobacter butzleri]|uniref:hypothetical protein n=1 Tax=Aliarcobacter butzleri TaxID=28197 RepID=UPI00126A08B2|nr:hypothetical protein [Aliarcobacter butzleri]
MRVDMNYLNRLSTEVKNAKDFGVYQGNEVKKAGFFTKLFNTFGIGAYKKEVNNNRGLKNKNKYNMEALDKYLSKGGNPNAIDKKFNTSLLESAKTIEEMSKIIAYGGDVNARDNRGKTLLEKLSTNSLKEKNKISSQDIDTVARIIFLLKNGANLEKNLGMDLLKAALKGNDKELSGQLSQVIEETNPKVFNEFVKQNNMNKDYLKKEFGIEKQESGLILKPEIIISEDIKNNIENNKQENIKVEEKIDLEVDSRINEILSKHSDKSLMTFEQFRSRISNKNTENSAKLKYENFLKLELRKNFKQISLEDDHTQEIAPGR